MMQQYEKAPLGIGMKPGIRKVYVSKPEVELDQPYQELVGYAKTALLAPEKEEVVKVTFRLSDFASCDEKKAAYVLEKGDYIVRVGNSSVSTTIAAGAVRITLSASEMEGKKVDYNKLMEAVKAGSVSREQLTGTLF